MSSLNSNLRFVFFHCSHTEYSSSDYGFQSAFLFIQGLQLQIKDFKMIQGESWSVPGDLGRVPWNSFYPLSLFSMVSNDLKGQQRWRGYERLLLTLLNYYSSQNQKCFSLWYQCQWEMFNSEQPAISINPKHFDMNRSIDTYWLLSQSQ